jgi:hypothetical protein
MSDQFPALQRRRHSSIDRHVDEARRVLWRAFQRGALSEDEFASTLERLEFIDPATDALVEEEPDDQRQKS